MKLFSLVVFTFSLISGNAQEEITTYSTATPLPSSINSNEDELMPLVTPDGGTFFFVRDGKEENPDKDKIGQNIFRSTNTDDTWSDAEYKTSHLNNESNNAVVGISTDGSTLYLVNAYQKGMNNGIAISHLKGEKWTNPEPIEIPGMQYHDNQHVGFYVHPEENVMLISMVPEGGSGLEDLHISFNEAGNWSTPKLLGSNVNSSGYEMSPFLSGDQQRIYFTSNGHGGMGDADIFYIDKLNDSWEDWSDPVNLGEGVNSSGFDAYFSIGLDSLAYFSSNRNGGQNDIYTTKITIEIIEEEEPIVEEIIVPEPEVEIAEEVIETPSTEKIYKVQVGAFQEAKNFNGNHLRDLGVVEKFEIGNGITTFTIGSFTSISEAKTLKEKAINSGQSDAFVISFIDGKRTYPETE